MHLWEIIMKIKEEVYETVVFSILNGIAALCSLG
jgi:hypothetical protein